MRFFEQPANTYPKYRNETHTGGTQFVYPSFVSHVYHTKQKRARRVNAASLFDIIYHHFSWMLSLATSDSTKYTSRAEPVAATGITGCHCAYRSSSRLPLSLFLAFFFHRAAKSGEKGVDVRVRQIHVGRYTRLGLT